MSRIFLRTRWSWYAVVLAGVLLAGHWAGGQDDQAPTRESATVRAPRAELAATAATAAVPSIDLEALSKRSIAPAQGDLFPAISWERQAQEERLQNAPPPPPPPRPRAPPLPFSYMGKMIDDRGTVVFLVHGDRNLIVRQGDTVQGTYHVESIDEQAMVLTYLPLREKQSLPLRSAGDPGTAPYSAARAPAGQEDDK